MADELIYTTVGLRCPVCGLVPHGEHERERAGPRGDTEEPLEAVCGVCWRIEKALEDVDRVTAALDEALRELTDRVDTLEARADAPAETSGYIAESKT